MSLFNKNMAKIMFFPLYIFSLVSITLFPLNFKDWLMTHLLMNYSYSQSRDILLLGTGIGIIILLGFSTFFFFRFNFEKKLILYTIIFLILNRLINEFMIDVFQKSMSYEYNSDFGISAIVILPITFILLLIHAISIDYLDLKIKKGD